MYLNINRATSLDSENVVQIIRILQIHEKFKHFLLFRV